MGELAAARDTAGRQAAAMMQSLIGVGGRGLRAPQLASSISTGDDGIPRVSPYRLATHLTSAFGIYTTLIWTGMSVLKRIPSELTAAEMHGVMKLRTFSKPLAVL